MQQTLYHTRRGLCAYDRHGVLTLRGTLEELAAGMLIGKPPTVDCPICNGRGYTREPDPDTPDVDGLLTSCQLGCREPRAPRPLRHYPDNPDDPFIDRSH